MIGLAGGGGGEKAVQAEKDGAHFDIVFKDKIRELREVCDVFICSCCL